MNRKIFLFIGLLLLLLVACTPSASETAPVPEPSSGTQWGSIQPSSRVKEPAPNADILELLAKNKQATNYHYAYDANEADGYEVFVLGSKVKKRYAEAKPLRGEISYNTIYLDTKQRTAVAICNKPGVSCGPIWNKAYPIDYGLEEITPTLTEIAQRVSNPQEVGSEVLMNRELTIIEYVNAGGKLERLSLDDFYGLPSRQVIYGSDDNIDILESHTFTRLSVGQLREEDVTLPEEYVLQG